MNSKNNIKDILLPEISFIEPSTKLKDIAQIVLSSKAKAAIVGTSKEPLGIITEHDFVRVFTKDIDTTVNVLDIEAREIMTFPLLTIPSSMSYQDALLHFKRNSVNRFVVTKDDFVIGILTYNLLSNFSTGILENLMEQVNIDALTQIKNKAAINQEALKEFEKIQSHSPYTDSSLLFIDIDFFKKINDSYGHLIGDIILKELANILKTEIRQSDEVGRFGGEEFIILLRRTDHQQALRFAQRLRKRVSNFIFNKENHKLHLTISIGIAQLHLGKNIVDVLSKADDALYAAKREGRDRVGFWLDHQLTTQP